MGRARDASHAEWPLWGHGHVVADPAVPAGLLRNGLGEYSTFLTFATMYGMSYFS